MYTYEFTYEENLDDGFGNVQFCAENKKEAEELFTDWQHENGFAIDEYKVNAVFNLDDAKFYGKQYKCKEFS